MTKTLPITQAREELPTLVNNAKRKFAEYIITVKGIPAAVIISHAEYESWKETNEILSDQQLMEAIREGEEDVKAGRYQDWGDVKKELQLKRPNHVSNKTHSTGKKRAKKA